jgi:hypothetical protein
MFLFLYQWAGFFFDPASILVLLWVDISTVIRIDLVIACKIG